MYSHILIPMDMDHEHALKPAQEVAEALLGENGRITLLHVTEEIPGYVAARLPEELLSGGKAACLAALKEMEQDISKPVESHVISGSAGSAIVNYAEVHHVDCIVILSHKPGLEDYFLGSTAARVVRHAPCCVHVIR